MIAIKIRKREKTTTTTTKSIDDYLLWFLINLYENNI
jgi:hypothetical protein